MRNSGLVVRFGYRLSY